MMTLVIYLIVILNMTLMMSLMHNLFLQTCLPYQAKLLHQDSL